MAGTTPGPDPHYTERLQVRVSPERYRQLQILALVMDTSISKLVRIGINDLLDRAERRHADEQAI